jgi:biopolymer transport protein ExbD
LAFGQTKKREELGFLATPMVDMMFILLIFIIITAQYTNFNALKVNLPRAESGASVQESNFLIITISLQNKIFLNQKPVTMPELEAKLKEAAAQKQQPFILIQADAGTTTGRLVSLMDSASKAGLSKISIETKE